MQEEEQMETLMEMIARREEESRKFYEAYAGNPEKLATDLDAAIQTIEKNGYIVKSYENRDFGELNEKQPVAYKILHGDYSTVYGFGTCDEETVIRFADRLCADAQEAAETAEELPAHPLPADPEKEREYDLVYNEGGEGYNPHRMGSVPTYWRPERGLDEKGDS